MSEYLALPRPRVLAHRGLAVDAPENTPLAFAAAVAAGADYIETDVHVSRDGVAVVAHDPDLGRVAGRRADVAQLTMSELRRVDLGSGQSFASLDEVLDAFGTTRFNIDVKTDGAADPAVSAIRRTGATDRVLLTSFSERRRRRLAAALPEVATSAGSGAVARAVLASAFGRVEGTRRAAAGAVAFQVPERQGPVRVASPRFVETAHRAGIEVHVWTVNDPGDMARLLDLGIDGLVTDRADLALEVVRQRN